MTIWLFTTQSYPDPTENAQSQPLQDISTSSDSDIVEVSHPKSGYTRERTTNTNIGRDGDLGQPQVACTGIIVKLPKGVSPHTSYPYGLHEEMGDKWDYAVVNGVLTLYSRVCQQFRLIPGTMWCRGCQSLERSGQLDGILTRMVIGVHENA